MSVIRVTEDVNFQFINKRCGESRVDVFFEVAVLVAKIIFDFNIFKIRFDDWWCWIDYISLFWVFLEVSEYFLGRRR